MRSPKYKIDEVTIAGSEGCKFEHRCMFEKGFSCGVVTQVINKKTIIVICKTTSPCKFRFRCEQSSICTCPVRKKLWLTHKV